MFDDKMDVLCLYVIRFSYFFISFWFVRTFQFGAQIETYIYKNVDKKKTAALQQLKTAAHIYRLYLAKWGSQCH